jgi:O-antigen ligase
MDGALLIGREQGAAIMMSNGEEKNVHNVPLAYALETGLLGFTATLFVAAIFLFTAIKYFVRLIRKKNEDPRPGIVLVIVSTILFFRPMISASFDVYFSVGEWCAFALFLALKSSLSGTLHMKH